MMKHEFERLAGYQVSIENYEKYIEPMYMATDLNKEDFTKCINRKFFEEKKQVERIIKTMAITDNSGYYKTPNGCYLHTVKVEVVSVSTKTGKIKVKIIPDSYKLGYSVDFYLYDEDIVVVE